MTNENEIRKVEEVVDDLQYTVEIHAYIVQACTLVIVGVIGLMAMITTSTNNLVSIIAFSIPILIGSFLGLYHINTFKYIANRSYSRKTRF
ncbi:hypothetical protein [Nostoc sp.]|uniref:hypothetical protein n=1 Tax=Nostoc sp. TaxID=1180 RepID=UPI002FFBED2D